MSAVEPAAPPTDDLVPVLALAQWQLANNLPEDGLMGGGDR